MSPADLEKQALAATVERHRKSVRWHLANLLEALDGPGTSPRDMRLDDLVRSLRLWDQATDLLADATERGDL
jgi:hypothetical protein